MGNHGGSSPPDRTKSTCESKCFLFSVGDLNGSVSAADKQGLAGKSPTNADKRLRPRREIDVPLIVPRALVKASAFCFIKMIVIIEL